MMSKYKLLIAYDGSNYRGWQRQTKGRSIQGEIERALSCLLKEEVRITGAGRTDAGVHALGQTAHFMTAQVIEPKRFLYSLNALIDNDIRIHFLTEVDFAFHAQKSASHKIYHYHLWLEEWEDPFLSRYRFRPKGKLSLPLLQEAASHFVGTHDFASFANVGSSVKTTTRTLYRLDIVPQTGGYRLEFEGDGFLYKMVRNITGTLIEIALNKRPLSSLPPLFTHFDRRLAGTAAPPHALFLMAVHYPTEITSEGS